MKKIYLILGLGLCGALGNKAMAQPASVVLIPNSGAQVVFPSITSAYAAIPNNPTMSYTIEILPTYAGTDASEVYPIQLTDKGIPTGSTNTITIRPSVGNNGEIIQRPTPAFNPVIQFNGGDNVILDGRPGGITSSPANYLTVNQNFTTTTALPTGSLFRNIELLNTANNNVIRYINAVAAPANSTTGAQNIVVGGTTGTTATSGNNNNIIENNVITGGTRAVQDFGVAAAAPNPEIPNNGTIIRFNNISGYSGIGIFGGIQTNITIHDNFLTINGPALFGTSVEGIRSQATSGSGTIRDNVITLNPTSATITAVTGITVSGTGSTGSNTYTIERNRINGLSAVGAVNVRGLSMFPGVNNTLNVRNNWIAIMGDNASATAIFGMLFGNTAGSNYTANVYFNTVRIGGTSANTTVNSYGIYKSDANTTSVFNVMNNISMMERDMSAALWMANQAGTNNWNFNNYYGGGANGSYAAVVNIATVNTPYTNADLAAFRTAMAPNEQNTTFSPVTFVSNTDLHLAPPSSTDPNLQGTPVAGITTDIDNNTRNTTSPYKGADEPGGPVPVQLFTFSGASKGSFNHLTWSTATESNNHGFELQRSVDGVDFQTITFVPSKSDNGSSVQTLTYTFDDYKPFASVSYYRLKQVDKDGRFTLSNTVTIKGKGVRGVQITNLYPNPVVDAFNVVMASAKSGVVSMVITDMSGKTVMSRNVSVKAGDNIIPVQAPGLQSGLYTLRIVHQETLETNFVQFTK